MKNINTRIKLIYLLLTVLIIACSSDDNSNLNNDIDIIAPVITILGEANVSIVQNTTYVDAGATATDNVDGDLTSIIVTSGSVNVGVEGVYTITYSVSDVAGNIASASRQVSVTSDDGNPVYLAQNGVTIKAKPWALVGDSGEINGVTYTVVDEAMLRDMVVNEDDVTKLATTKVNNMRDMFLDASAFNQPIGNWDVSSVTDMIRMFFEASAFNQDISNWDVSNVTYLNMMFINATSFNQDISNWDVSNVNGMSHMFAIATSFNQDISNWDVSNVTRMDYMFTDATSFNQDISNWDVSNVTNMNYMFTDATSFNQDLSSWNVNGVTMCGYFYENTPQWTLPKPNFTNCIP